MEHEVVLNREHYHLQPVYRDWLNERNVVYTLTCTFGILFYKFTNAEDKMWFSEFAKGYED